MNPMPALMQYHWTAHYPLQVEVTLKAEAFKAKHFFYSKTQNEK